MRNDFANLPKEELLDRLKACQDRGLRDAAREILKALRGK